MDLFLISGVSGAGKTVFLKALEDLGYYCVDNLPVPLILDFIKIMETSPEFDKIGLVIDIREKTFLSQIDETLTKLDDLKELKKRIVFLDAKDDILIRRFSETRRRHTIDRYDLEKSIEEERKLLKIFKDRADVILDTSAYSTYDLRKKVKEIAQGKIEKTRISIKIMSFGYKYGLPIDVDIVFDMRFLPNPFYVKELKNKTGKDLSVQKFIKNSPVFSEFVKITRKQLLLVLEHFEKEDKNFVSIAFGCTGGQHRSVYAAEIFYRVLKKFYPEIILLHRDIEKNRQ